MSATKVRSLEILTRTIHRGMVKGRTNLPSGSLHQYGKILQTLEDIQIYLRKTQLSSRNMYILTSFLTFTTCPFFKKPILPLPPASFFILLFFHISFTTFLFPFQAGPRRGPLHVAGAPVINTWPRLQTTKLWPRLQITKSYN